MVLIHKEIPKGLQGVDLHYHLTTTKNLLL